MRSPEDIKKFRRMLEEALNGADRCLASSDHPARAFSRMQIECFSWVLGEPSTYDLLFAMLSASEARHDKEKVN